MAIDKVTSRNLSLLCLDSTRDEVCCSHLGLQYPIIPVSPLYHQLLCLLNSYLTCKKMAYNAEMGWEELPVGVGGASQWCRRREECGAGVQGSHEPLQKMLGSVFALSSIPHPIQAAQIGFR